MGRPLFKASDGGQFDNLRGWEEVTESELLKVSGMPVLFRLKVRPEAFPTGSPMSVFWILFQQWGGHEDMNDIVETIEKGGERTCGSD